MCQKDREQSDKKILLKLRTYRFKNILEEKGWVAFLRQLNEYRLDIATIDT